jgi:hypothetical protein
MWSAYKIRDPAGITDRRRRLRSIRGCPIANRERPAAIVFDFKDLVWVIKRLAHSGESHTGKRQHCLNSSIILCQQRSRTGSFRIDSEGLYSGSLPVELAPESASRQQQKSGATERQAVGFRNAGGAGGVTEDLEWCGGRREFC